LRGFPNLREQAAVPREFTEAFLARHLGGRYQPVGGDFAGSSLKIETGGELVPGISR